MKIQYKDSVTLDNIYPVTKQAYIEGITSPIWDKVQLESHRGLPSSFPENTIVAFQGAVDAGFEIMECDIRRTSDGVFVLLHDDSINRTSNYTGSAKIWEMSLAQVLTYDFGSWFNSQFTGTQIPTLTDMLKFCRKRNIVLELDLANKSDISSYYSDMIDEVRVNNMVGKTMFKVNPSEAITLTNIDDGLIVGVSDQTSVQAVQTTASLIKPKSIKTFCSTGDAYFTTAICNEIKELGMTGQVWTITTAQRANELFDFGVDIIMTNNLLLTDID